MLRSVKHLILFFCWFLFITNAINAQDFEPELPDYLRKTTTTTTTTTTTSTTEGPPKTTTQPRPTLADTTTNLPSTNFIETTTSIPQVMTTTRPTVPRPTHAIPTWIPPPTTTLKPHYSHYWKNCCYYKEQRGRAYLKWVCGQLHWVSSVECFHCCYNDFSGFAGCSKVLHQYCAHYIH